MIKVAVDAMGGDFSFPPIISGVIKALKEKDNFSVILVGDEEKIKSQIPSELSNRVEFVHTTDVFDMDENSTDVLKRKDSSIYKAVELVRNHEANAVVSAGHSGATMSLATLRIGRVKGVLRPAIATLMPTFNGRVLVLDVGANVDCEEENLLQFAIMGEAYAKEVMNIKNPKIALLSNGEEDCKGNKLTKDTHKLLREHLSNFMGNVEGGHIFAGECDVVVCDGFTGNILLKTAEGAVGIFAKLLKNEIKKSSLSKLGYMLSKGAFNALKQHLDYDQYGGAPLLGIDGCAIISHGKSNEEAIKNAIFQALKFANSNVNKVIEDEIKSLH
ncbi:phosphate acyltransferase PlsX [Campylobacter sp. RM12640]|uniref:phosphate acyltransferase PlsX n=1 Tax=unclassified Campylobacter TaxID=2593542 RepID=UPI001BD952FA|nr:phosphate acyltransferase PlsX [Campylobacter sp. 2018MI13]MBZ7975584.1 phosphate acyltransferase PlsX [Campylobacter sp. RM12637]MBZ7979413.1 phosphate acyltransferase PlsX [Campylobacter sp. RM12642]MBZ7981012.1 phosphate acyltransferase PlsX [Campylobacter sp. RM12640]MBZ7983239.1 phosphate acyltransferase PlsX [Campylobacter sp. RM12647]MBZ7988331.1 phosphate acyltransferase PlsX [Campylobacter sp. RM12635]MBZ7990700.1 phosphate acyltransferase PlsX [Campylobacter sp. RM9331]MBZ799251